MTTALSAAGLRHFRSEHRRRRRSVRGSARSGRGTTQQGRTGDRHDPRPLRCQGHRQRPCSALRPRPVPPCPTDQPKTLFGGQRHAPLPDLRNLRHNSAQAPLNRFEITVGTDQRLVHIKRPINLDLHRVLPARRPPIGLRDIGPRKRRVARHHKTRCAKAASTRSTTSPLAAAPNRSPSTTSGRACPPRQYRPSPHAASNGNQSEPPAMTLVRLVQQLLQHA